jgi:cell division protease FtsH
MVTRWGMSPKVGPVNFGEPDGQGPLPFASERLYGDATAQLVDSEARRIIDECMENAQSLLRAHRESLDALVKALLAEDTLDQQRILTITGLSPPPKPAEAKPAGARGSTRSPV